MKLMIELSEDVFVRLFDNGSETDEQDRETIETAIRKGTPLLKYHTDSIVPYVLHRNLGCPLNECVNAYEKAIEYLRSMANMKG